MKPKTIIPLDNQIQQSQPFQWILNLKSTFQMYYESAAKSLTHCFVKRSSAAEGAKMKWEPLKRWISQLSLIESWPITLLKWFHLTSFSHYYFVMLFWGKAIQYLFTPVSEAQMLKTI